MSECVVRMKTPTSCEECPLVQTDENDWGDVMSRTCNLIYKGYLSDVPKGERRADCPIICALPEGHGRLIDADAYDYPGDLKWEPTIVPADEYPAYMSQWLGKAISAERSEMNDIRLHS